MSGFLKNESVMLDGKTHELKLSSVVDDCGQVFYIDIDHRDIMELNCTKTQAESIFHLICENLKMFLK